MKLRNRAALALAALAISTGIARAELTPMAQSFTGTAPGPGGGQFFELYAPTINSSGLASFKADINVASNTGIFRSDGTNIVNIARQGQSAPGAGLGTFTTFATANAMNSAGQVAILGNLTGTNDGSTSGVFRGDGTLLTRLARDKELAPAGGNYAGNFSVPYLNSIGQAAFTASLTGTTDASSYGIFRTNGVSSGLMARDKQAAPGSGGGLFTTNITLGTLLDSGYAIFLAGLTGTSDTSTVGIFSNNGTGATAIVRNRQSEPGGGVYTYVTYQDANSKGDVAYVGGLSGASDGAISGLFRSNGASAVSIARFGQVVPGGGAINGLAVSPNIGSGGHVAFNASITTGPDGATSGMFRGDGTSLETIVRDKQPAPGGGGGTFQGSTLAAPAINATGTVAFGGFIVGTAGGTTDDYGIFLADPQEMITVARKGQSAFGSVINFVGFSGGSSKGSQSAFNDAGQVMFDITNNDGYKYVVRYTPELHFRSAGGGNWDNNTNWTVGLRPGAVHDVFVDPPSPFGATVYGPTTNVSVKSLTIAGRNGGSAQLILNGGGNIAVSNAITIGTTSSLTMQNGNLSGASLSNAGALSTSAGSSMTLNSFLNSNYATISGAMNVAGTFENDSNMNFTSGAAITAGAGITNLSALNIDNPTVTGNFTNSFGASLGGRGTISGTLNNQGTVFPSGLLSLGGLSNSGMINLGLAQNLRISANSSNSGTIALNGGALTTTGAFQLDNNAGGTIQGGGGIAINLRNVAGLINANGTQPLVISNLLGNLAGGQMRVADGSMLNVNSAFTNSGLINLGGGAAIFSGLTLTNSGTIRGAGTLSNPIANSGTIRADEGLLTLSGVGGTTTSTSQIHVSDGATLLYSQGLGVNAGTLTLTGGTFDNNNQTMSNTGRITGWGEFSSLNLTNNGSVTFTGGFTTINGTVTNAATDQIRVAYNPALFTGNVINGGIFKSTSTTVTFAGTYMENGTFISDPADNFFNNVSIGPAGAWVGGVGDRFFISGDMHSQSAAKRAWQTTDAELHFTGGIRHLLSVMGSDVGISFDGYDNNFAWGSLTLGGADQLTLQGDAGAALYVHSLLLSGGIDQISSISGNGINLYYDLGNPANAYLNGGSYALTGGGSVMPVPEPQTALLLAISTVIMSVGRRRRC